MQIKVTLTEVILVRDVLIKVMFENVLSQDESWVIKNKIRSFLALFHYVIVLGGSTCEREAVPSM